jgi:hypothetical protein
VFTAANVGDARAAQEVFAQMPGKDFPRLEVVQADNKYHSHGLGRWLRVHHRPYRIRVVSRPAGERRFIPLRSRWVVERTFAWLGRYRRLSRDYEHTAGSGEAVHTLFAPSVKRGNPEQGGRFNLDEKLVLAACDHASSRSTRSRPAWRRRSPTTRAAWPPRSERPGSACTSRCLAGCRACPRWGCRPHRGVSWSDKRAALVR